MEESRRKNEFKIIRKEKKKIADEKKIKKQNIIKIQRRKQKMISNTHI